MDSYPTELLTYISTVQQQALLPKKVLSSILLKLKSKTKKNLESAQKVLVRKKKNQNLLYWKKKKFKRKYSFYKLCLRKIIYFTEAVQRVELVTFLGQSGSYSFLNIDLYFRRRTLFFSFNFVIPNLIIAVCSIVGFILPPESGEKVGLRKFYFYTLSIIHNLKYFK